MRMVLPFSTKNCLPPVLITAYAISLSSQTVRASIEKSIIIGISLANGNRPHLIRPKPLLHFEFSRSEEHTSELQSLRHLVCRLLLEKKKTTSYANHINH